MNDSNFLSKQMALCVKDLSLKNDSGDFIFVRAGTIFRVDVDQNLGFLDNCVFEIKPEHYSLKSSSPIRKIVEAITTQDISFELGKESFFIKKESPIFVDTVEEIAYFEKHHFDISRHEYLIST